MTGIPYGQCSMRMLYGLQSPTKGEDCRDSVNMATLFPRIRPTAVGNPLGSRRVSEQLRNYSKGAAWPGCPTVKKDVGGKFTAPLDQLIEHYKSFLCEPGFADIGTLLVGDAKTTLIDKLRKKAGPAVVTLPKRHFFDRAAQSLDNRKQISHSSPSALVLACSLFVIFQALPPTAGCLQ